MFIQYIKFFLIIFFFNFVDAKIYISDRFDSQTKIKSETSGVFEKIYTARVLGVTDNLELIIERLNHKKPFKIVLANLKFPKKGMQGYNEVKNELRKLLINQTVKIKVIDKDKLNKPLAIVYIDDLEMNLHLIENGYAWHFKRYAYHVQTKDFFEKYKMAQKHAKESKKGIWKYNFYK